MSWGAGAEEYVGIRFAAPCPYFVHADRPSTGPDEGNLYVLTIGLLIVRLETLLQTVG